MDNMPEKTSAFEKRIKKHVIGKQHRFLAIAPLGFENTLLREFQAIGINAALDVNGRSSLKISNDGKVEFIAKITEAWKAIAFSRIANRILMEIALFRAENFRELEKHITEIPWNLFLELSNAKISLHTTCKHSRLYHSDAIEERVKKIIEKKISTSNKQIQQTLNKSTTFAATAQSNLEHLYINLLDDRCTIWLDLAGEELYKRGHNRFVAEAPLKETIAAAMIFEASRLQPSDTLTTSHQPLATIIDPMAGSGTFSLEAAYIANKLIPGICRDFALKHHPAFKASTWNYIIKSKDDINVQFHIITSDISEKAVDIIRHNVKNAPIPDSFIFSQNKNFFDYSLSEIAQDHQNTIILLNPPYGKRLNVDAPKLYTKIGKKLNEFKNCIVAILAPKGACTANLQQSCKALNPKVSPCIKVIETSHGGFSLNAIFAKL